MRQIKAGKLGLVRNIIGCGPLFWSSNDCLVVDFLVIHSSDAKCEDLDLRGEEVVL